MKIDIKNLNKTFTDKHKNKRQVLENINLNFESGNLYSVIGKSGSGKTVLMNFLSGLTVKKQESLIVDNKIVNSKIGNRKSFRDYRKENIMSFQFPDIQIFSDDIYKEIRELERNFNKNIDVSEFELILKDFGFNFNKLEDLNPLTMSDGEKRKYIIALYIILNMKLLILDEPTTGLDPVSEEVILKKLEDYSKKGTCVVIVTHNLENAYNYSDKVILINKGIILWNGSPNILKDKDFLKKNNLYSPLEFITYK